MYDLISFLTRSTLKWFAEADLIFYVTVAAFAAAMALLVMR